jgi:hypothetical protein
MFAVDRLLILSLCCSFHSTPTSSHPVSLWRISKILRRCFVFISYICQKRDVCLSHPSFNTLDVFFESMKNLRSDTCILKHDQQDATLYNTLYYCQCCPCFKWFSAHHQELKSVHAASGSCETWLRLPREWMSWDWFANQSQIPDAACTDLSSWWWAGKPIETCRALTIIKSIIQRCVLLVRLKNTLTMHGPMNFKKRHMLDVLITYGGE